MTLQHNDWVTVPSDRAYWHPGNSGFTRETAEFRCRHCGDIQPFDEECPFCGAETRVLATGSGLPGVFCTSCQEGAFSYHCPNCDEYDRMFLSFYYDPRARYLIKQSKCFIATACVGSASNEVAVLSRFRDDYLRASEIGRQFIRLYELVSPPVAEFIAGRRLLKQIIAGAIITPIARIVERIWKKRSQ